MSQLTDNYKMFLYKTLTILNDNYKSKVELVQNIQDDKIYVRKILINYNIEVYKQLKELREREDINIPYIYEIIELDENKLVIIEEFINGKTLDEIYSCKVVKEDIAVNYCIQLCDILDKIHNLQNPIIHRDLKPSNIIIDNNGIVKLMDFDVSRVYKDSGNRDTRILGTEGYAAPEQFGFQQTDVRSDIYSIGVLLNVLTVGEFPRDKKNSGKLYNIIERCTKISPDDRYSSVKELKKDLLNCNKFVNKTIDKVQKNDFKLPGFRSGKVRYKIIATLWYLFLTYGLFNNFASGNIDLIQRDIIVCVSMLMMTLFYGNYYSIQNKLPISKSKNILIKILGLFLYTMLILLMIGILVPKEI